MNLQDEMAKDAKEILANTGDFGTTVTFVRAQTAVALGVFNCIVSDRRETETLEIGAFLTDYSFTITCQSADFAAAPAKGDLGTVNGVQYRVGSLSNSEGDPYIDFHMQTIQK